MSKKSGLISSLKTLVISLLFAALIVVGGYIWYVNRINNNGYDIYSITWYNRAFLFINNN